MALLCISSHAVKRLTAGAQMCAHETGVSAGNTAGILLSKECVPFQFFLWQKGLGGHFKSC